MNPFSGRDDLPPGTTLADVSRRERNRRDDEEDELFWRYWFEDQELRWREARRRECGEDL